MPEKPKKFFTLDDLVDETPKSQGSFTLDELTTSQASNSSAASMPEEKGLARQWVNANIDALRGVGAGVWTTGVGAYDLARKAIPALPEPSPFVRSLTVPPQTFWGKTGKAGEQIGEFIMPGGAIGKATQATKAATAGTKLAALAPWATRAALEGASAGAITAAQTGDIEQGARSGLLSTLISGVLGDISPLMGPFVKSRLNPVQQKAIDAAEKAGVPISVGQKIGSRQLQRIEQGLENVPGSAGRTQQFFETQEQALDKMARNTVASAAPGVTQSEFATGQAVPSMLRSKIAQAKSFADKQYESFRTSMKNAKKVSAKPGKTLYVDPQTGRTLEAFEVAEGAGVPLQQVGYQTFEAPATIAKKNLRPLYQELTQTMPEARRQASPGYQALKQIMEGPDVVDGVTLDRNLGAIKAILRTGSGTLRNQSQRYASQTIQELEQALNKAAQDAGPNVAQKLFRGRKAVAYYHDVDELLSSLPDEPGALYKELVSGGDRKVKLLNNLKVFAPKEVQQVGRTFLDGLLQKATAEGGFHRAPGIMADWTRMGPETKLFLFGSKQAVDQLDKFFLASKILTSDKNPSGTAKLIAALGPLGAGLDMAFGPGTAEEKLKRVPAEMVSGLAGANLLSRMLLTPGGAGLLTRAITNPIASPAFSQSVNGMTSLMTRWNKEDDKQNSVIPPPPQQ